MAIVAVALWLAVQIISQGVCDQSLDGHPARAVLWRGDSAAALRALAYQRLSEGDNVHAARLARRAVALSPLDTAALSAFGLALDRLGEPQRTEQVMTQTGRAGWRDGVTQVWLFRTRLLQGRYQEGFDRADAVLRRTSTFQHYIFSVLAVAARDPRAIQPLARRLETNPPWRSAFLAYLSLLVDTRGPPTAHTLLTQLSHSATPPTLDEVGIYVSRMLYDDDPAAAAAAWRELRPNAGSDTGIVYDGGFETPLGLSPFDWRLDFGPGWTPSIEAAPGQGHGRALRIEYDGVSPPKSVYQRVILPPGAYRFSVDAYATTAQDPRVNWVLTCGDTGARLMSLPVTAAPGRWTSLTGEAQTPASGCRTLWLQLRTNPGDTPADLVVWFDNVSIAPTASH